MANLPETPQWEEGIYQIEVSDPVLGGPDGISNRQGKQLASRTLYLKQQVEKGGSDLAKHIAAADPHTQYAPKASPTFTGTPTAPTPANSDNSKKLATTEFVAKALAALAGSAPETLDTLKELADALGNDPNFATTVLNKLAEKLAKDQNGADIPDPALFVKNLGLKSAAQRDVGTGTNQIPDMASFAAGPGWMKFPSGKIIQYGYQTSSSSGSVVVNFPIPFPTQCFGVTGAGTDASAANIAGCQIIDKAVFFLSAWLVAAGSVFNRTATNISWIAVGI
ncbi:phage tail protein [Enterobacter roggenkampii]